MQAKFFCFERKSYFRSESSLLPAAFPLVPELPVLEEELLADGVDVNVGARLAAEGAAGRRGQEERVEVRLI